MTLEILLCVAGKLSVRRSVIPHLVDNAHTGVERANATYF